MGLGLGLGKDPRSQTQSHRSNPKSECRQNRSGGVMFRDLSSCKMYVLCYCNLAGNHYKIGVYDRGRGETRGNGQRREDG